MMSETDEIIFVVGVVIAAIGAVVLAVKSDIQARRKSKEPSDTDRIISAIESLKEEKQG